MKKPTLVNHPPPVELASDNHAVVAPIYQSVKFEFDTLDETERFLRGERSGFLYSRASNPTTRQLELLLAQMQGRDDCLVAASGVGAISQTLLALTKAGDHILCFVETYGPTLYLIRRLLARFNVTHSLLSIEDTDGIEKALAAQKTRLVVFESPTNPMLKIADIGAITQLARSTGALTLMDNTFAGFHQHGQFEVDLFMHSLTKYASGAGDVMGGAVIGNAELIRSLRRDWGILGSTLDPHAAFLILRGLKTYYIRYQAQCATAARIAQHLSQHPGVARTHYPGLPEHPCYGLARAQMQDFGTMVTVDLNGGAAAGGRFADALQLFAMTASLGSTESLVLAPPMMRSRDLSPDQQRIAGVTDSTVRLSIGLEDVQDLLEDVTQALAAAGTAP